MISQYRLVSQTINLKGEKLKDKERSSHHVPDVNLASRVTRNATVDLVEIYIRIVKPLSHLEKTSKSIVQYEPPLNYMY